MSWLVALLTSFFKAAGESLRGFFRDRQAVSDAEEKGQAKAEAEGLKQVNEIADRQTKRAADSPSEDDILNRLDGGTG